jgi:pimeloyl-ACP methyl ester carboxylesterase
VRSRVWLRLAAAATFLSALGTGCGDGNTTAEPSPEAVDTAEAVARDVRIEAPYSTTPMPEDDARDTPIVLDGRVFGDGETGVILAHMRPADQTSWFPFATRLAGTGKYTVLTFDFRGFNASTGEKEFNRVDTDLMAAVRYMRDELGIQRILLVGASMGGTAALIVAQREAVDAVISISSPAIYQDIDALEHVSRIRAPKLFVTSEDDLNAARSQEQFWAQAVEPKEQVIYPGDAHGTNLFASPVAPQFEQTMLDFLDRFATPPVN